MTADERQKLYDAIGYEENTSSDLPKEVRSQTLDSIFLVVVCYDLLRQCY